MDDVKYLICKRGAGLGDSLHCMSICWWMAKQTGRTLVIDWTDNQWYAARNRLNVNVFLDLFEKLTCATCFDGRPPIDRPSGKFVHNIPQYFPHKAASSETPALELNCFLLDQIAPENLRPFYDDLVLIPFVQKMLDEFAEEHFGNEKVFGIHIRHGDGEKGHFVRIGRVFKHPDKIVDRVVKRAKQEQSATGCKVFLATDSLDMYDAIKEQIPDVIFRMGWRPPRNKGGILQLAARNEPTKALHDAAVDMWLLSRCYAFIQPSWSYFTSYPTAMEVPKIPL